MPDLCLFARTGRRERFAIAEAQADADGNRIRAKDKLKQKHASGDLVQEREVASANVGISQ